MFASLFGKAGRGSLKKQGSLRKSGSGKLGGMDGKDVDRPTGPRTRVNKVSSVRLIQALVTAVGTCSWQDVMHSI
jgi:hypothetical protein